MDDQAIRKIDSILHTLVRCKNKMLQRGAWDDFVYWLDKPQNIAYSRHKIKRGTIENAISDYKRLKRYLDTDQVLDPDDKDKLAKLDRIEEKAKAFVEAVEAYISTPNDEDPFHGKAWFVYFFYVGKRDKEPQLGRGVLQGYDSKFVELENLPGSNHRDYAGTYSMIHNQVCFLDLETPSKDRKLHIKVYYSLPEKDEILLGSYITFENNEIVSGTILFERVTTEIEKPHPAVLSYKNNPKLFNAVHPSIKKFLLLKRYNHHKIPNTIHTYSDLQNFLVIHDENWKRRFIEEAMPRIFIASPGLSINKESFGKNKKAIDYLIEKLHNDFASENLNISVHNNQDNVQDLASPKTLVGLQKTKFFVLIYTKTTVGSYSLVQLGWALAHCKVVMIFYEEGSISEHVTTVPDRVIKNSFTDLNRDIDQIYGQMKMHILRNS